MQVLSAEVQSTESRAARMLREIFESGRPLLYVRSSEEQRVAGVLREVALRLNPSKLFTCLYMESDRGNAQ